MRRLMLVTTVLALGLACGSQDAPADKKGKGRAEGPKVTQGSEADVEVDLDAVVALAKKIKADPENAKAMLEASGLDRVAFEAQLYAIAQDPKLTDAYLAAMQ